jgi:8-oxo-dGTP pyrophosphatase MutT (NUDIX family)
VHCVAVCLDGRGRCLIAKRRKTKRLFPGYWEFGCGQLKVGQSFEECLVQAYWDDFDAKLDRASLRPLSTFMIDGTPKIPGIIFTGRVSNSQSIKAKKHSELRWITPNELPNYADDLCVPEFNATVLASHALFKSH